MKFSDITSSYALEGIVLNLVSNIFFYTILALIGGAFGGFLGKRRYAAAPPSPYTEYSAGEEPESREEPTSQSRKASKASKIADSDPGE